MSRTPEEIARELVETWHENKSHDVNLWSYPGAREPLEAAIALAIRAAQNEAKHTLDVARSRIVAMEAEADLLREALEEITRMDKDPLFDVFNAADRARAALRLTPSGA